MLKFGTFGSKPGEFDNPRCIALDGEQRVYVVDTKNNRVEVFDQIGDLLVLLWRTVKRPHGKKVKLALWNCDHSGANCAGDR